MLIALCAPFMEADLLEEKIRSAAGQRNLRFDEYNDMEAFFKLPNAELYDGVFIAFDGAKGMEAVVQARERLNKLAVVWISDDAQFGLTAFSLQVAAFLVKGCKQEQLAKALERIKEWREMYGNRVVR